MVEAVAKWLTAKGGISSIPEVYEELDRLKRASDAAYNDCNATKKHLRFIGSYDKKYKEAVNRHTDAINGYLQFVREIDLIGCTTLGKREPNEDACFCDPKNKSYGVFDGLGGK